DVEDWGCGTGMALWELADTFPRAHLYGYGHRSFQQWKTERVTFIQDVGEKGERYFRRIAKKNGGFDLIYSRFGTMYHAEDELKKTGEYTGEQNEKYHRMTADHLHRLSQLLKAGGKLVIYPHDNPMFGKEIQRQSTREFTLQRIGRTIIVTRDK
ncbi:MAG: class I SAM-dependent methyltransferase, partial [archaeon]